MARHNAVLVVIIDLSVGFEQRFSPMFRIIWAIVRALVSVLRSHRDLLLEIRSARSPAAPDGVQGGRRSPKGAVNLALRQQLAAFKSRGKRPHTLAADRAFWVVLRRLWARWADVLVSVKPDTVVR